MGMQLSDKTKKEIGKRLRNIREQRSLTQQDVATKMGFTPSYYARFERGVEHLNLAHIEVLTKILKVKSSDILPF